MDQPSFSLVADVGGTNTRLALAHGPRLLTESVKKLSNADHNSLGDVIRAYLGDRQGVISASAVAIAGPVHNGRGTLTNLDWSMDEAELAEITGASHAAVVNDLAAQAHGLGHIAQDHLRLVSPGSPVENAPQLVIGAGTGFNAALALLTPIGPVVTASECGHVTLPVRNEADLRLIQYLEPIHGFASVEDALSGRGVAHIYAWLAAEAGKTETLKTADIMQRAAEDDSRALEVVATYVRLLGNVAGDLALTHLPFGGVYLIGGVARAMAPYFARFGFVDAFSDKGRFTDFMAQFPISVIEDDFAALAGLAAHLTEVVKN